MSEKRLCAEILLEKNKGLLIALGLRRPSVSQQKSFGIKKAQAIEVKALARRMRRRRESDLSIIEDFDAKGDTLVLIFSPNTKFFLKEGGYFVFKNEQENLVFLTDEIKKVFIKNEKREIQVLWRKQ